MRKAGIHARVDVYKDWFHAYDLFFPFTRKGKEAIRRFEEAFREAAQPYRKEQHS